MKPRHDEYHISTDNNIVSWQAIVGDPKRNTTLAQILRDILKKVDREDGKCLIPVTELARLRTLYNYDDKLIKSQVKNIQEFIDSLDLSGFREQIYSLEMVLFDIQQELEAQRQETAEIKHQLESVALKNEIPKNISQLKNDTGYIKPEECEGIFDVKITELNPLLYDEI